MPIETERDAHDTPLGKARALLLSELSDGRALRARELARAADLSPRAVTEGLASLARSRVVVIERSGGRLYWRIASPEGARALLEAPLPSSCPAPIVTGPRDPVLRRARTCYRHLAGEIGVAVTETMLARGYIEFSDGAGSLTEGGRTFLSGLGLAPDALRPRRGARGRGFCRPCLDWSERRPHIGGALGAAMCGAWFERGWIRRLAGTRAVALTKEGRLGFQRTLGLAF